MTRKDEWERTITWTLVFFTLLIILSYVQNTYPSVITIEPTFILAALIPFLLFLVASGQLKRFGGGGFEVVLQEQARKLVSSNKMNGKKATMGGKEPADEIPNVKKDSPDTLVFILGESSYDDRAIREYIDRIQSLKYIVFTDSDGLFKGYVSVEDFDGLVPEDGSADHLVRQSADEDATNISSEIQNGNILFFGSVVRESIEYDSSNEEALRKMAAEEIDELPVVNANGEFVGVVTRDEIVRNILTSVVTESASQNGTV